MNIIRRYSFLSLLFFLLPFAQINLLAQSINRVPPKIVHVSTSIHSLPPQLGKDSIKDVIKAMTLDEKVRLVVGVAKPQISAPDTSSASKSKGVDIKTLLSEGKVAGSAGEGFAIARLNIPSLVYADGPAGLRIDPKRRSDTTKSYFATGFPVATLLASTWDTEAVKNIGMAIGNEVHEYGVDVLLAPSINIHRNPLTGRNFEYYSEDPVLTGNLAAAMINGIQSNGVGTSIKHFAANNQETSRTGIDVIVSQRALREIYLKGFEIAINKSQPWTVMSSYNKINGTYASHSYDLLTTILKNEWGFKGFVMTDWWAGNDPVAQMKAGNDLLMPGDSNQVQTLKKAVADGRLSIKVLDANVERILGIIVKSPAFKHYEYSNKPDLQENAQLARSVATQGMVLLQNKNNTLPIATNVKNIALFGNSAYDIIAGGTGSGNVNKAYKISLSEGLINSGYLIDTKFSDEYKKYIADEKAKYPKENFWQAPVIAEMKVDSDAIDKLNNEADVALISIGRNSGEGEDRKIKGDYELTNQEKELIQKVSSVFHAKGKKVIIVMNIGGVIEVASWRDKVDAILLAWQPGQEGGNAIADVLSGKVNPSGKLATTFAMNYNDIPSGKNFPGTPIEKPIIVRYDEGIYVGYRYFNTFHVKTAYEFGYGLSYTKFTYSDLKLSATSFNGKLTASVKITNAGKVSGKEIVQCYLTAPAKELDKPAIELKAFAKTKLLKPGKSEYVTFDINADDLASFNNKTSSWNAEAGTYYIKIGASSINMKQTAKFQLGKRIIVRKANNVLMPQK